MRSVIRNRLLVSSVLLAVAFPGADLAQAQPGFTTQPASTTIFIGQNSSFSCTVTGAAPLGLQWFKDDAAIALATNRVYSQTNVPAAQAGNYFLVASNAAGSATSAVATLTVIGGDANFRLVEFTDVWRYDASGRNLGVAWRGSGYGDSLWPAGPGVLAKSAFSFLQPINTALPLTNSAGSAIITYYFRTHFNLPAGHSNLVLFATNLLDDGAVFYLNGAEAARLRLSGVVASSTLAASAPQNGTSYEPIALAATNLAAGDNLLAVEVHQTSATSSDVVFGMNLRAYPPNAEPLSLLNQPVSQIVNEGQSTRFFADVFGGQPVVYQWFKDGAPISDATNAALLLPSVHGANAGGYSFIASNLINAATSTVVNLSMVADQTPPVLLAVFATNEFDSVMVIFSELVSDATALDSANYSFSPGVTILKVQRMAADRVLLLTSGRDVQLDYTLTVGQVTDQADATNIMAAASMPVGRDTRVISSGLRQVQTVFVIVMENQDWAVMKGNTNCPYINSLLPSASYCTQYYSPNRQHPSQPNYIWLEAGDNFGYADDAGPATDRIHSTNHLATLLNSAGIDWRGYMESMPAGVTGTNDASPYVGRHNPFAFFDDVTTNFAYCTNHVRPYSRFAGDLAAGRIGRYNFLTPNITNDMHALAPGSTSLLRQGDLWLSRELPRILSSAAFSNQGAVFITWDESFGSTTNPTGMIVLSPLAKGGGYASPVFHDHSSTLCTMQVIFGVRPFLGAAADANTLSELFQELTLDPMRTGDNFSVRLNHVLPGKTHYVQVSSDLLHWSTISTNVASGPLTVPDPEATNHPQRFYRVIQAP